VGGSLLQFLGGRMLALLLRRGPLARRGRPREEVSSVVLGLLHLGCAADAPFVLDSPFRGVVSGRGSERLADGLERRRVVPIGLVLFIVVFEGGVGRIGHLGGRGGHGDHGFGFAADGDMLLARRPGGRRGFLRLVPFDVLDRSEELVEILEQIVALVLVVGH
jgi:hypothetical protein